ncbi:hypothetical protein [Govanella unica]|uniref:Uncharacterized protein n=1 Tax=Govanella unica TaxID=2975056 RepID=A0A9X3Z8E1_9PROT|nr:hypothetical protein [Govania unica]MDA5195122.1 hypothetical protein [Govania unica]
MSISRRRSKASEEALDDQLGELDRITDRADLRSDGVTLTLDLKPLASELESSPKPIVLTHTVPMEIQRRDVEMRLVLRGSSPFSSGISLQHSGPSYPRD